jgi:hypothetical protein
MAASSLEDLKGRIAAGEYAVDAAELAGDIVGKFALVRRVSRLMHDDEAGAGGKAGQRRSRGRGLPRLSPAQQRRLRTS